MAYPYSKNQNMVSRGPEVDTGPVQRVKTDGRIGSATPPGRLTGGLSVDHNRSAQPHCGDIGSTAAKHMSPGHEGGDCWSPRVAKARAAAKPYPRKHGHPVNLQRGGLVKVKPD